MTVFVCPRWIFCLRYAIVIILHVTGVKFSPTQMVQNLSAGPLYKQTKGEGMYLFSMLGTVSGFVPTR